MTSSEAALGAVPQVHMTGGAPGILWYALASSPEFVTELYGVHFPGECMRGPICELQACIESLTSGAAALHAPGAAPDGSYRYYGAFFGSVPRVLAANCVWLLVIFGWTFGMMAPFFYILKLCGMLRITPEEEEVSPLGWTF